MTPEPEEPYTLDQMEKEFPDKAACLEWLKDCRYPRGIRCVNCKKVTKHYLVTRHNSYSCSRCGEHTAPTSGTIFYDLKKPLNVLFKAVYIYASKGPSLTAKELHQETGLSQSTAGRFLAKIRERLDRPDRNNYLEDPHVPPAPGEDSR